MVTVINFKQYTNANGEVFNFLVLQGGVEFVQSKETGNFYATARKTTMTSTFDEMTCKALIGQQLPGTICKIKCQPYDYTVETTGEIITLEHKYQFVPEAPTNHQQIIDKTLVA